MNQQICRDKKILRHSITSPSVLHWIRCSLVFWNFFARLRAPSFRWDVNLRSWLVVIKNPMALLIKSKGVTPVSRTNPLHWPCQSWPPNNPHPLNWIHNLSTGVGSALPPLYYGCHCMIFTRSLVKQITN